MSITAKSVIFDIEDNHGDASYLGVRQIDFYLNGFLIPLVAADYTAYATSELFNQLSGEAFDTSNSKTGAAAEQGWRSDSGNSDMRLIVVFDDAKTFDEIRVNNYHASGGLTTRGINNVKILTAQTAITDTTYGASISGSSLIFDGTFSEHSASDAEDEEVVWDALALTISRMIITDASENKLHVEVEQLDLDTEKLVYHVRIPEVSSTTDTKITLDTNFYSNDDQTFRSIEDAEDDFTGTDADPPDVEKWIVDNQSASGTAQINSNKLRISIPDTANDERIVIRSTFEIAGDFDIQIDFDEISNDTPSSSNSFPVRMDVSTKDGTKYCYIANMLLSDSTTRAVANSSQSENDFIVSYDESTGKIRFTRSGSTIKGYYWKSSQWEWDSSTSGHTFTETTDEPLIVKLWVLADFNSGATTDYDNFTINSAESISGFVGKAGSAPSAAVWDDNFISVYHMAQDLSSENLLDSTGNGDGTPNGSMTSADLIDAEVGKAQDFDGTDDFIDVGNTTLDNLTSDFTLEVAGEPNATGETFFLTKITGGDDKQFSVRANIDNGSMIMDYEYDGNNFYVEKTGLTIPDRGYFVNTMDSSLDAIMYLDGTQVHTDATATDEVSAVTDDMSIGQLGGTYQNNRISGTISEIRVSSTVRSAAWIEATNLSLTDSLFTIEYKSKGIYELTIDSDDIDSDLTDFPAMVVLNEACGKNSYDARQVLKDNKIHAKSVVIDIADNWGDASFLGLRQIDFYLEGQKLEFTSDDYTAYSTSSLANQDVANVFDTSTDKDGAAADEGWRSDSGNSSMRLIAVFDWIIAFDEIRVNNYHASGTETDRGAKNVVINASLDSITETTYEDILYGAETVYTGQIAEHSAVDEADEETLYLTKSISIPVPSWYFQDGIGDWVDVQGEIITYTANPSPYLGVRYMGGGDDAWNEAYLRIPVDQYHLKNFTLIWQQASYSVSDPAALGIRQRDSSLTQLDYTSATMVATSPAQTWVERTLTVDAEDGVAYVDIVFNNERVAGTYNSGFIDAIVLQAESYYLIEGTVKDGTTDLERDLYLYDQDTGAYLDGTTSDSDGIFTLVTEDNSPVSVVAKGDETEDENDLVFANITPVRR